MVCTYTAEASGVTKDSTGSRNRGDDQGQPYKSKYRQEEIYKKIQEHRDKLELSRICILSITMLETGELP